METLNIVIIGAEIYELYNKRNSIVRGSGNYFHVIHPVKQSKKTVPVVCVKFQGRQMV
jgi:hypothetical protein